MLRKTKLKKLKSSIQSKSRACSTHAKQLEIQEMNMLNSIFVKHHVFKPMDNFTKHAYEQNMENSGQ